MILIFKWMGRGERRTLSGVDRGGGGGHPLGSKNMVNHRMRLRKVRIGIRVLTQVHDLHLLARQSLNKDRVLDRVSPLPLFSKFLLKIFIYFFRFVSTHLVRCYQQE